MASNKRQGKSDVSVMTALVPFSKGCEKEKQTENQAALK